MAWNLIGSAQIGPDLERVTVGQVQAPEVGGLIVKVGALTSAPFQFGYCLLSYVSSYGRELGTVRVWPRQELEVYHLGEGLRVRDRFGSLVLEPRTWNLRWIKAGFPLSITVLADLPDPVLDGALTPDGFTTAGGADLFLSPSGDAGRLTFPA